MKLERTKNAGRNIIYGILLKLYQMVAPFLIRTAMIYYLGMQYIGINSLFVSILQVLNLAELGVGTAMVFSMYKPIAEDDEQMICALMRLYRAYYRIIGLVVLGLGIIAVPFLPHLIKDELPADLNLYILYSLNLGTTVVSYWLFAYKNCLLTAHQRNDIISRIGIGVSTVEYVLELLVIVFFKSYYAYLIVRLVSQIVTNVVTAYITDRLFPNYFPHGRLDKEVTANINNRVRDLFTAKLGGVITNSADNIVISSFLGLTVLAIYNNYYYILSSVIGVITIIFTACIAGIGNSLVTESREKNYKDFKLFTFIVTWIIGFCTCCFLCLFQPFMKIWLNDTSKMLGMTEVVCFCLYFFVYEISMMMIQYKDAAGMWHEDRFRPLVTSLTNLILNLLTVKYMGLLGVLLSTVISFAVVGIPWLIKNLFTQIFHISPKAYLKRFGIYLCISIVAAGITFIICSYVKADGLSELFLKGIICCIIPNMIFIVCYHRFAEFKKAILLIRKLLPIK